MSYNSRRKNSTRRTPSSPSTIKPSPYFKRRSLRSIVATAPSTLSKSWNKNLKKIKKNVVKSRVFWSHGSETWVAWRLPLPSTPATWGVDSGYPDSGYPTLATYKADTGYPTLATPTLATYKGWHRLPIGGDTGYLFFSVPLLDKVMFFECLEIYANVIKRIF